jgi:hypothetical protein
MNAPSPSEETSDGSKDSFCEELGQVFSHFSQYNMKNGILVQNGGERVFSNRQLGLGVSIRVVLKMVLE